MQCSVSQPRIEDNSTFSRWRLSGLPSQCGAADVLQLLEPRKWEVHEALYVGEFHAFFLATTVGDISAMQFNVTSDHKQTLRM